MAFTKSPSKPTSVTQNAKFRCDVCQKPFKSPSAVQVHRRIHFADTPQGKPFACTFCPATFTRQYSLDIHLPLHTGIWRNVCATCEAVFRGQKYFKLHKLVHLPNYVQRWYEHHKIDGEPFKCDVCGALFSRKGSLRTHQRIHQPGNLHTCDVCQAAYAYRSHLNDHVMFSHKGLKPFSCTQCDSKFARKGELATHKFVHSNVKPLLNEE